MTTLKISTPGEASSSEVEGKEEAEVVEEAVKKEVEILSRYPH